MNPLKRPGDDHISSKKVKLKLKLKDSRSKIQLSRFNSQDVQKAVSGQVTIKSNWVRHPKSNSNQNQMMEWNGMDQLSIKW